ncbi:MAG TPA: dTDP-4-dehydrorhamnose 3,5-epimerase [Phnomibacter sp.]|nr:dTDP-4-dehydrorhamnose 3,5-epimerase [Phnomibacter sp.]
MKVIETPLKDCYIIENTLFGDSRGYFFESFNQQRFAALTGWQGSFVQDNQSHSSYGVVRGLHFQQGQWAQAKLVRVLHGRVLDVAVDIRPDSPSFGQSFAIELADDNRYQLFIPRGFAHGFSVLSPSATFFYKCDNQYNKASEAGFHPYDPTLNINWQIPRHQALLSEKDQQAMSWLQWMALQ